MTPAMKLIINEWKRQNLPLVPFRLKRVDECDGIADYRIISGGETVGWAVVLDNRRVLDLDIH